MAFALTVAIGGLLWWQGPEFAERHAPSSSLVWLWDHNLFCADWAEAVLRNRVNAAILPYQAGINSKQVFRTRTPDDHDWAGEYGHGMIWLLGGRSLYVTPDEALWSHSGLMQQGPVMRGRVAEFDGVRLRLELPVDRAALRWERSHYPHQWMDSEFVLVRWEDWRYLVAPEELIDFCNDVNAGEPLDEFHLTRRLPARPGVAVENGRPASGQPPLPHPFNRYILDKTLQGALASFEETPLPSRRAVARVTKLLKRRGLTARVYEIEVRSEQSGAAFPGMRLYCLDRFGIAHVLSAGDGLMRARYVEFSPTPADPMIGDRLSTSAPVFLPLTPRLDEDRMVLRRMPRAGNSGSDKDAEEILNSKRSVSDLDWWPLELSRALR